MNVILSRASTVRRAPTQLRTMCAPALTVLQAPAIWFQPSRVLTTGMWNPTVKQTSTNAPRHPARMAARAWMVLVLSRAIVAPVSLACRAVLRSNDARKVRMHVTRIMPYAPKTPPSNAHAFQGMRALIPVDHAQL